MAIPIQYSSIPMILHRSRLFNILCLKMHIQSLWITTFQQPCIEIDMEVKFIKRIIFNVSVHKNDVSVILHDSI
jgi:hypothetical protein